MQKKLNNRQKKPDAVEVPRTYGGGRIALRRRAMRSRNSCLFLTGGIVLVIADGVTTDGYQLGGS